MKIGSILHILSFCILPVILFAQSGPVSTTELNWDAIQLDARQTQEGAALKFSSPNLIGQRQITINGEAQTLEFINGEATQFVEIGRGGKLFLFNTADGNHLVHLTPKPDGSFRQQYIPLWMSLIPPLVAIVLALLFKEVVLSLFLGVFSGAFIAGGMQFSNILYNLLEVVQRYVITALNDSGHLSVIVFSLLIGGMVAIISRNGGMAGVVLALSKYARSAKSSQFITWVLGIAIFFDDYANTLIVGNTMRSVTDKFRISREKLAYIVDSTAAPVSAIAFITTWIGAELGYIEGGISQLENFDTSLSPYSIFISSLKYSFYPVLALAFIVILIWMERDYGPMHKAEVRARTTGQVSSASNLDEDEPNMEDLSPVKGAPLKWYNAVIPVITVILITILGLVSTGMESITASLAEKGIQANSWGSAWGQMNVLLEGQNGFFMKMGKLIGDSDSYVALLWASLSGVVVAIIMTLAGRIMKLLDTIHVMTTGFKTMLPALIILTLAWALAITTEELHTATYITNLLRDSISPVMLPPIIFVLAAAIAFSTGSSWSTMAILYPIAIPTAWGVCMAQGYDTSDSLEILFNVISTVLAASVLGDHCSPISDTTILSSLASDCNHIDHVRTQLPYALTVGSVSILAGTLAALLGGGWLVCFVLLLISLATLVFIVRSVGKRVD